MLNTDSYFRLPISQLLARGRISKIDSSIDSHLIVGQSVHSIESARIAYSNNVDYIVAGTIFESKSHPGGPISGTKLIAQIKNELDVPVIGIGGINQFNVKDVMSAGADGIAVIGSVLEAQDPVNATKRLKTIMNENFRGWNGLDECFCKR